MLNPKLALSFAILLLAAKGLGSGFVLDTRPSGSGKYPLGGAFTGTQGTSGDVYTVPYSTPVSQLYYGVRGIPMTTGSCSGTIQYKYHWTSSTGDKPPSQVILKVTSQCFVKGTGSADDGLADPTVNVPSGGTVPSSGPGGEDPLGIWGFYGPGSVSQGTHYVIVDVQNGAFEYNVAPVATAGGNGYVGVRVAVYNAFLNVEGTKPDSSVDNGLQCLVGQRQTASVSAGAVGALEVRNQVWSVPGANVFGRVVTDGPPRINPDVDITNGSPSTYVEDHEYDSRLVTFTPQAILVAPSETGARPSTTRSPESKRSTVRPTCTTRPRIPRSRSRP